MAEEQEEVQDSFSPENGVENDPFHPSNIGVVHFIIQARIYDVLMSLLAEANPEAASRLMEIHNTGALVGNGPRFNGTFVADNIPGPS